MESIKNTLTQQIFFINDLEIITGKDRLTLRRWWSSGKFPSPVKLHGRALVWHRDIIEDWINSTIKVK